MDAVLAGLEQLLQFQVLTALVVGAIVGVIIGAIPGVGPAVAIAILLPVTFAMEPLTGLTLLLGIYAAGMYGGAIPSILINTPGTVVNVLTTYDGYPMTKRGEGRRALTLAYSASFVGGIVSVIVLMLLALPLADFAKRFGSAEFAMATLFAMVIVVVAHRDKAIQAAMTLGLGLFFATIGIERAFTTQRFTFDQPWLLSGIPLIPMILGLFAMSQGLTLLIDKHEPAKTPKLQGSPFQGLIEVFKYPKTLFASAGFGVFMGILPGVGEFMAQFFSYSLAQRVSEEPEMFGNGAP
ncbi:MAG: tripartite tricarboxylate transporter permease [Chloroflexota bacterium]